MRLLRAIFAIQKISARLLDSWLDFVAPDAGLQQYMMIGGTLKGVGFLLNVMAMNMTYSV